MSTHSTISRRARVLRGHPRRVRAASVGQRLRRQAFQLAVYAKGEAWLQGYKPLWEIYAANHAHARKCPTCPPYDGDQWFLKVNILRIFNGLEATFLPPET